MGLGPEDKTSIADGVEGWHGGDIHKLWFKSKGERNTALKADYDIDGQLLYGRFLRKYYDFQVGLRGETQTYQGRNVSRAQTVIGVEGLVPYNYEVEAAMFISQNGHVSGRVTLTKDLLLSHQGSSSRALKPHWRRSVWNASPPVAD